MKNQLNFLLSGGDVTRYHTVRTIVTETVSHHSHQVALLCLMIDPLISRDALVVALMHDMAEQTTGDLPSPAKREYGIGDQVSELETRVLMSSGLFFPENLTPHEGRVIKLADIAQGALFCVREMALGNSLARIVFDRYMSYARDLVLVGLEKEIFTAIEEMVK